jgi:hypothetical protein
MQSLGIYFKQVTLGWESEHLETGVDHWLEQTRLFAPVTRCHLSRTRDGIPFWDMSGTCRTHNSLEGVGTD